MTQTVNRHGIRYSLSPRFEIIGELFASAIATTPSIRSPVLHFDGAVLYELLPAVASQFAVTLPPPLPSVRFCCV